MHVKVIDGETWTRTALAVDTTYCTCRACGSRWTSDQYEALAAALAA